MEWVPKLKVYYHFKESHSSNNFTYGDFSYLKKGDTVFS